MHEKSGKLAFRSSGAAAAAARACAQKQRASERANEQAVLAEGKHRVDPTLDKFAASTTAKRTLEPEPKQEQEQKQKSFWIGIGHSPSGSTTALLPAGLLLRWFVR